MTQTQRLSGRERQVLDILYTHGLATAAEVRQHLDDPPSNSAVRALLRTMESKGLVCHQQDGPRYVFRPAVEHRTASRSALQRVVKAFFGGSPTDAAVALLEMDDIAPAELARLRAMVEEA
jgi:predicted transcriptional regulator